MSSDKKAALLYKDHLYFFSGRKYVIVALHPNQHIVHGPGNVNEDWTAFKDAGFNHIDAILPISDSQHPGEFYVFSGTQYIWMKLNGADPTDPIKSVKEGEVISISTNWKSLVKAGWNSVDAALLNVQKSGQKLSTSQQAFFWKGNQCINIKYTPGPLKSEEIWSSFKSEGINGVDTVFEDADPMKFWVFFNNTEAIQVKYNGETGSGNDWVELGKGKVIDYFPPLKIFYP